MFSRDLSYALRTLRKNPVFTLTAIVTVALGIGASTAIFSVVNALLLRPLPYASADRLALIKTDMVARNVINFPIAPGNMPDLLQHATAFQSIAGAASFPSNFVADDQQPEQVINAGVTTNFFTTLGAHIPFGRNFSESDGTPPPRPIPGTAPSPDSRPPTIAILSYGFWQRRFGGDSSVIGKTAQLNNAPAQIVGVAAPDFRLEFPTSSGDPAQPDLYTALRIDWATASRINVQLRVFGRLAPGATLAEARGQLAKLTSDLQNLVPIMKTAKVVWRAEPMQADVVKDVRPAVLSLMGAVLFVLLIACANVANLLLVRASSRERELAVRSALGGDRRALITQMLVESVVIAGGGAIVGLALAKLGIALLLRVAPASLPRLDAIALDPTVLAFTIGLAMLSAFTFGMLPAIRASRPNLAQTLRAGGRSPGLQGGKHLRNGVVIAEVALSFVLLIGAGLMVRSFMALEHVDPGFDPDGVMTFTAFNTRVRGPDAVRAYENEVEQKLRAIPGVTAVTAAGPLPLDGGDANLRYGPQAAASDPSLFRQATDHFIRPGYFAAMRTKVLAGRDFTEADNDTTSRAIIIDDALARTMFPGVPFPNLIGRELLVRVNTPDAQVNQIVGVVEHQRHETLAQPGREAVYIAEGRVGF
ncbi:MAG TPA: ABC transporter permease, partial [Gemmatimonadaceae bacterium]|nr:ABC transporter permease [Gemmatimonadaceae bacterium]